MKAVPAIAEAALELAGKFSGQVLQPTDAGYEDARKVHNGLVNKRPALIVQCRGVADVVDAVNLAQRLKLEVAVRGGGHNVAGRATIDGGLMIDLSPMKGIYVDPEARIARAQAGANWGEFNRETQLQGLAATGGQVTTTGIAGLTLGGGFGWLMGKYGLAIDSLRSVEIVTADGRVLRASADENADLFWAVRGGGGNFGIATSFEFRLHAVGPMITGGLVFWPLNTAVDVLRLYRELTASASDDLTMVAGLLGAPDGSTKASVIGACHCGAPRDGALAVRAIKAFGSPVFDSVGPMTYCEINAMLDAGYPRGARNYWKSHFLPQLSDEVIRTMAECYEKSPSLMSEIYIERMHGAAARVGVDDTAFPLRSPGYNVLVLAQWTDPADDERCTAWARETYAAIKPFVALGRYVNYLDDDEPGDQVAVAYGPNYRRLREIKAKYDPDNFFRMNQNIRPLR